MHWIDYGLLALRREVISERVPPGRPADLAPLCTALAGQGLLAGLEVGRRFYEIGSVTGRDELETLLADQAAREEPGAGEPRPQPTPDS